MLNRTCYTNIALYAIMQNATFVENKPSTSYYSEHIARHASTTAHVLALYFTIQTTQNKPF